MSKRSNYLNLAVWQERSAVNGPGERFVLWVQGCSLRCPGRFNPEMQPFVRRHMVEVEQMASRILTVPGIEGVTYTGGEPMVQAQGLALLNELLRPSGLTVVCYTGYTLEALRVQNESENSLESQTCLGGIPNKFGRPNLDWVERLLSCVDILIDGPYVREKAANLLWRGSSNQRVHFPTDAYRHLKPVPQQVEASGVDSHITEVEFAVGNKGFTTTGIWPEGFLQRLSEVLRR